MFVAEWQYSTGSVAPQCSLCKFQSVAYICVFHLLIVSIVLLLWTANCCDVDDYAAGWSSVPLRTKSSADVHIGHRKSVTSEPAGTSANRRRQVADVDVIKNSSVVTTTKLSLPPQWLATIEPYSVVGGVSTHVDARCHASTCVITASKWRSNQTCLDLRCTTSGNARQRAQCECNSAIQVCLRLIRTATHVNAR